MGWDQLYYLTDKNEKIAVDFVGRFENFQTDFGIICDRIGIDQQKIKPLNRIMNRSNHKHYSEYYTPETRAIVQHLYQRDIDCFNYKFERTPLAYFKIKQGTKLWLNKSLIKYPFFA